MAAILDSPYWISINLDKRQNLVDVKILKKQAQITERKFVEKFLSKYGCQGNVNRYVKKSVTSKWFQINLVGIGEMFQNV